MGATAVYSGTFDPLTNGHANIVARAAAMFDTVIVAVAISTLKNTLFTIDERIALTNEVLGAHANVKAIPFDGLIVDFAQAQNATVILRGVRSVTDFDYELQMAGMNRRRPMTDLDTSPQRWFDRSPRWVAMWMSLCTQPYVTRWRSDSTSQVFVWR